MRKFTLKNFFLSLLFLGFSKVIMAQSGAALAFDGNDDYVAIPKPISSDFTIEFWMKTTSYGGSGNQWYYGPGLVDAEVGGVTNDFGLSLVNGCVAFGIGNPDITIFTPTVNSGNWVHIAASWKRTTGEMKLYMNGSLVATGTSGTAFRNVTPDIKLGSLNYGWYYYNGSMDEVRIWDAVRTDCEINAFMNCEIQSFYNNLKANYHFNQGYASGWNGYETTLYDYSGWGNNGYLYNFYPYYNSYSNWVAPGGVTSGLSCNDQNFFTPNNGTAFENSNICQNKATVLTVNGGGTYAWYNSPTSTSPLGIGFTYNTPTLTIPGVYTYYVVDACAGLTSPRLPVTVTVNALPVVSVSGGTVGVCPNTTVALTGNGASSYTWVNTGDVTATVIVTPTANTTYTVIGSTPFNCTATAVKNVTVNPTISIAGPTLICNTPATINLTASGANTYTWSTGAIVPGIIVSPTATTVYSVAGTYLAGPCLSAKTITVTVSNTPTLSISGTFSVCKGQSVTLTGNGANTYSWSNGTTGTTTAFGPTVTTAIMLTGTNVAGCANSAIQLVTVQNSPDLIVFGQTEICGPKIGSSVVLTASYSTTYLWNTGATTNSITVTPSVTTVYSVTGTHTLNACTRTQTIQVYVGECTGISNNTVDAAKLHVYPNPNNGSFMVEWKDNSTKTVEIIDITGRVIRTEVVNEEKSVFNISDLPNSIYYLRVKGDNTVMSVKIIKE